MFRRVNQKLWSVPLSQHGKEFDPGRKRNEYPSAQDKRSDARWARDSGIMLGLDPVVWNDIKFCKRR